MAISHGADPPGRMSQERYDPYHAMTADAFHEDMVKAAASGMNAHMAKPIDPEQLYHLLKEKILKE